MATHETGELADSGDDDDGLSTHDEHEHEHEDPSHSEHTHRRHESYAKNTGVEDVSTLDYEATGAQPGSRDLGADDAGGAGARKNSGADDNKEGKDQDRGQAKDKDKYELEDQTNLLPVRQVIVIFMGLNCALFCSLLDQTM
jgi:hypothetical protein